MGWVDGVGYELLLEAVRAFHVDCVVVMGHDKTFASLSEDLKAVPSKRAISCIKLARSGGVVERGADARREARAARVRAYFYGLARDSASLPPLLSPETITVKFEDVTVLRVGGAASEVGLVPLGKTSALDPLRLTVVTPTPTALLHQLLGVSFAATDKQVPHVNCAGFVHVRAVNVAAKTITLLAPCALALPSRFLILGAISWVET
jgi:polyribonucleotide 5'-hydroxyl-kinase